MSLTVRIDLHVHSEASSDASDPSGLVLEQAAEVGLDAVVITDHDVIYESVRAAELAPIAETAVWVRERGGIAIVPHPFRRSHHNVRKHRLRGVDPDAIEVDNSWTFTG